MKRTSITLPIKQKGENWKAFAARVERWVKGEDVRSRTDLRDWTGSQPFHLDREAKD